jgi:hypothetical protein
MLARLPAPTKGLWLGKYRHLLSEMVLPTVQRAQVAHYHGLAARRMAVVALAMRVYELDHGGPPGELVEKLAALVPPPRFNLVRYHGILAPSAEEAMAFHSINGRNQ